MQACWRNVYLDSVFIDTLQLDPLQYDLPKSGVLCLDFVSYDTPSLRHADLLCRLQTLRARLFRVKPPSMTALAATADPGESIAACVPPQVPASPGARPQSSVAVSPGAGGQTPNAGVKFSAAADGGTSPSGRGMNVAGAGGFGGPRTTRSAPRAGASLMECRVLEARQRWRTAHATVVIV